jgi:FtsP/CotA-like multicopper oxidase with cupredoxin domain
MLGSRRTRTAVWKRALLLCALCGTGVSLRAQDAAPEKASSKGASAGCLRPAEGSVVPEPEDLRSRNGVLQVELAFRSYVDAKGQVRYCFVSATGGISPTLRANPGDTVILRLKNEAASGSPPAGHAGHGGAPDGRGKKMKTDHLAATASASADGGTRDPCAGGTMAASATNLHFHGLEILATCHADETLKTLIEPTDAPFEYRFQIPVDQPPGMYWYHPHVHGFGKTQILGGASGALIVEGIERVDRDLAGLPERVFVVRDEDLWNPNAEPPELSAATQFLRRDPEGDALNTGTGEGKPAKDLSINYVPVPYPKYPPAVIRMKPSRRELWRVANASAITYLNLQVLYNSAPQPLEVVGLDGAPLAASGGTAVKVVKLSHAVVPPGGRVEFVLSGPPAGVDASLVTRGVDTGPLGENDPRRALAIIQVSGDAPQPRSVLAANPKPLAPPDKEWLGNAAPVRERKLYFSEKQQNPNDPNSPTIFFVTVEGQTPKAFDPAVEIPNMVARQGTVEDWTIENRTQEFHAFHIHGIHFLMTEWNGRKVEEPFLRDTVNIAYWDGKSEKYPNVKLRMDFRDANAVGILPYHCHLLEHQDNGMMGILRVEPAKNGSD